MEHAKEFPKFGCAISNTEEEYDSEVETFFTAMASLESDIGLLLSKDREWKENYEKILRYLADLETSIIFKRGAPESDFLKDLLDDVDSQDEIPDVLLRAKTEAPAILIRAQSKARDVMSLYVKMSRIPRFAEGFTYARFGGLQSLRKSLSRRAVESSKQ